MRVTYDATANAAYLQLADPQGGAEIARMYACDPVEVDGMINLDFDKEGRLVGIEVLAARSKLPKRLLEAAEGFDVEGDAG
ncbi:DUF2283 domain-containing protein [Streptomyces sp. NPDC056517]|uniref:DUF2283 domain-containing protein n=1 Tax=unclassified Streptomyces TaxID=2593676 RepID=UPI003678EA91